MNREKYVNEQKCTQKEMYKQHGENINRHMEVWVVRVYTQLPLYNRGITITYNTWYHKRNELSLCNPHYWGFFINHF